jgi:hypothetical protein
MDASERRYFRRFSNFHSGDKYYLELFDKLLEYRKRRTPPKAVRRLLIKESPKLDTLTRHLNERLLEALTFFYQTNSPDHTLSKTLQRIELLQYKGFVSILPKLLLRLYQRALFEEKYDKALLITDLLKQLWGMNLIRGKGLSAENLYDYTQKVLEEIQLNQKAWYAAALYAQLILEEGESVPAERIAIIDQYVERLGIKPPDPGAPLTQHFFYDTAQALRARLAGQTQKYLELTGLLVYKMEQYPKKLAFLQNRYILALNNYLSGLTEARSYEEAEKILDKLRSIRPSSRLIALQRERLLIFHELNLAFIRGHSDKVAANYEVYLDRLERTYLRTSPAYALQSYYLLAFNLYATQKTAETFTTLNRLEHGAWEIRRRDLLMAACIMRLLAAYDNTDRSILRQALIHVYKLLKRVRSTRSGIEKALIDFVAQALRGAYPTREAALDAFYSYLKHMVPNSELPIRRFWQVYFPMDWLEKKLGGHLRHGSAGSGLGA